MPFQLQGGNPATSDYDYQTGSGMDTFLSRSIDEVSWQTQLGSAYNSLSQMPIGSMPTTATPTNYDSTQISGSQGGSSTLGGSTGGSAVGGASPGAGVTFNASSSGNNIEINDGSVNRAIFGNNPTTGTWGFFATPPGTDISNAKTPQQLAFSTDYSSLLVVSNQTITFNEIVGSGATGLWQTYTIPHGQPNIPAYLAFISIPSFAVGLNNPLGFPSTQVYSVLTNDFAYVDSNLTSYQYFAAVDATNIYISRLIINTVPFTAVNTTATYQILQNTASTNNFTTTAQYATGTYSIA
jgi:hypothetical protein